MLNLLLEVKEFFSLKSETILNKIIEFIIKTWMVFLVMLFVVGWLTVVIYTITTPDAWDGVHFGLIDYIG